MRTLCAALSTASVLCTLPHFSRIKRSAPGSQFALDEDFNKLELSLLIIGLIIVTILYEKVRATRAALPADTRAGHAPTTRHSSFLHFFGSLAPLAPLGFSKKYF